MAKKLVAKVGEYTDNQGTQKSRWQNVGVIIQSNDGSEYVLLDPTVSLSGIMQMQSVMAAKKNEQQRDRIMCSIFDDDNQNQGQQQNQNYQQNQQQYGGNGQGGFQRQPQQNNGFPQNNNGYPHK